MWNCLFTGNISLTNILVYYTNCAFNKKCTTIDYFWIIVSWNILPTHKAAVKPRGVPKRIDMRPKVRGALTKAANGIMIKLDNMFTMNIHFLYSSL